jgi:hypothetical protein
MCRPSLVQPPEIRRLRDLTRYRRALVQDRTREQQRMEKLLEDAQIKISAVLSNLHGVTGRAIMDALIAGECDPRALAGLAKASARKKTDRLEEALRGFFTEHHATILQMIGLPSACPLTIRFSGHRQMVSVMSEPLWFRGDRSAARSFCLLALEIEAEQAE